jgi:hypothetical protein
VRACAGDDDLICARVDHQIGVVSDYYYLAFRLGRDEQRNEFIKHRFRIQVFFWLIDYQQPIVGIIERML